MYDNVIGRWSVVDPLGEKNSNISCFAYTINNPIKFVDFNGMDTTIYFLDKSTPPNTKREYSATVYVDADGTVFGPYMGSTYPNNSNVHNTLASGTHLFVNLFGHNLGKEKGLNIVNKEGERIVDGKDPKGNNVEMFYVNIHSGQTLEKDPAKLNRHNRGSAGCPTIHPDDAASFFDIFHWNKGKNKNSNTGSSSGIVYISRDEKDNKKKEDELKVKQQKNKKKGDS